MSDFHIDFARPAGCIRPLHGVNFGPMSMNGLLDFSDEHRHLRVPITRLHDIPFAIQDTVDVHYLFPNFDADPHDPRSYDFVKTDAYIQSILDVGSQIVFRLGESIEHFRVQRNVLPPRDPDKWAEICLHIVRHYNEGWADGMRDAVRYWEIWNEPYAPLCWAGTDEQFNELYELTSKRIKAGCPQAVVGGAGMAGDEPYWAKRVDFVEYCAAHDCPLDFFSWHTYTADPATVVARAAGVRQLLDSNGFTDTESHFNEWNYLPENRWDVLFGRNNIERRKGFAYLAGPIGAAFTAAVLTLMQDTSIDVANYYWAREGWFGLFDPMGVPTKAFYAMDAFVRLLNAPQRATAEGGDAEAGLTLCAGIAEDARAAAVLMSNLRHAQGRYELNLSNLPWPGPTRAECLLVDGDHDLTPAPEALTADQLPANGGTLQLHLPAPAVALLKLTPAE